MDILPGFEHHLCSFLRLRQGERAIQLEEQGEVPIFLLAAQRRLSPVQSLGDGLLQVVQVSQSPVLQTEANQTCRLIEASLVGGDFRLVPPVGGDNSGTHRDAVRRAFSACNEVEHFAMKRLTRPSLLEAGRLLVT